MLGAFWDISRMQAMNERLSSFEIIKIHITETCNTFSSIKPKMQIVFATWHNITGCFK